ncbi:Transcriptional repressor IclR [Defluviimonas aquaemixtae]|uniref:Transcriptional repressor IclR n=1 Tax=Albidovulum aquaemixtae TaxID=1542388 RepID=A0A2R8B4J0_9RHOB|nr:HTH-type transcriptional regulator BhcR [Defluviimonas aquaemixtae]SPH17492.1 Transcriptional repressor IclR [Defluviimonas aquaemixtae]
MARDTPRKGRPRNFSGDASQSTIQSLDRAFDVLETLAAAKGMTLSEIARALDQSPATVYRVLSTLEARGVVEAEAETQAWHVGATAFRLGSAFLRRSSVLERSQPAMRGLMETTGETSNLGIERNGDVLFVAQVETQESIRAFFPPGTISPMHASGIGKALLSRYDADQITAFLKRRALERFTDNTIVNSDALIEEMRRTRDRGYAFDDEEKATGMRCVAAPIINAWGTAIAGISVSGPTHRMSSDQIERIGHLVRDAAASVSQSIGAAAPA